MQATRDQCETQMNIPLQQQMALITILLPRRNFLMVWTTKSREANETRSRNRRRQRYH